MRAPSEEVSICLAPQSLGWLQPLALGGTGRATDSHMMISLSALAVIAEDELDGAFGKLQADSVRLEHLD
ncbi:hypothetical protein GCM10022206_58280 [Streptomyces chiangmaiensis]